MSVVFTILLVGFVAAVSLLVTCIVRSYALRHQVLDHPNARSSHAAPTPRGGGLAILAAMTLGVAIGVGCGAIDAREGLTLCVGAAVLGLVGWMDDQRGVRAQVRLTVHLVVAIWTMAMLHGLPAVRAGITTINVGAGGYVLGTIGIVWAINLFNFMDGIDGLAGSQAVIIFGAAAALLFSRGDRSLGTAAAITAAASAGFLVWNWPPARIFLGDAGSGALGYLVASLAAASENKGSVPLLVFAIMGGVFILDATVTLGRRIIRGDRAVEAHRDHAYQRLSRAWGKHRPVAVAAAIATLMLALLGTLAEASPKFLLPLIALAYAIMGGLFLAVERRAPMGAGRPDR